MKIVDDGEKASTYRGAKYGTIAGFIATWSISGSYGDSRISIRFTDNSVLLCSWD